MKKDDIIVKLNKKTECIFKDRNIKFKDGGNLYGKRKVVNIRR